MRLSENQDPITGEYPVLVALQGPLDGRRWLVKGTVDIGREPECIIAIEDRQVSRHHARIWSTKGVCFLEDLGSKNGTFLKGKEIEEAVDLHDGDTFQIALIQKFAFYSSDATMPMSDFGMGSNEKGEGLLIDKKSRKVWINNQELNPPLSAAQFRLLCMLYDHAGKVVSRNELIQGIWKDEESIGVTEQALDALIRRLRGRLQEMDIDYQYITTIRGHGVRFDNR